MNEVISLYLAGEYNCDTQEYKSDIDLWNENPEIFDCETLLTNWFTESDNKGK